MLDEGPGYASADVVATAVANPPPATARSATASASLSSERGELENERWQFDQLARLLTRWNK